MLIATERTSNEFKDAGVLTSKEGKRLIELFEISFSLTFHSTKKVFSTFEAAACLAVKFIQSTQAQLKPDFSTKLFAAVLCCQFFFYMVKLNSPLRKCCMINLFGLIYFRFFSKVAHVDAGG